MEQPCRECYMEKQKLWTVKGIFIYAPPVRTRNAYLEKLQARNASLPSSLFARRDLVEPYDLRYRFSADFDWCIRIMKKADVLHNTHLTLIDYLNEGMTTRNHKASLKERFRIMSRHYGWASTVTHHLWFVLRLLYK